MTSEYTKVIIQKFLSKLEEDNKVSSSVRAELKKLTEQNRLSDQDAITSAIQREDTENAETENPTS